MTHQIPIIYSNPVIYYSGVISMYQEMSTSVKKELILTGQEMVEIHNYKSVFKLHLSFMIHHKLMYAQQVKFSCQHYQN